LPAVASPKPVPVPDDLSAGYWAAAARGVLALPRCRACRRYAFPPRNVCPELDAQPDLRMIGRLVDGPDAPLRVGAHVAVTFDHLDADFAVPAFFLDHS
jgi:hypothetical protein